MFWKGLWNVVFVIHLRDTSFLLIFHYLGFSFPQTSVLQLTTVTYTGILLILLLLILLLGHLNTLVFMTYCPFITSLLLSSCLHIFMSYFCLLYLIWLFNCNDWHHSTSLSICSLSFIASFSYFFSIVSFNLFFQIIS